MVHFSGVRGTLLIINRLLDSPCRGYLAGFVPQPNTEVLLQRYLNFFILNCTGNNRFRHSLSESAENTFGKKEVKKKKSKGEKVSIINENDTEIFMYLPEAEKYAKRNNLNIVKLYSSTKEKAKYKFERLSEAFQSQAKTQDQHKSKLILLREGISKNDLSIKINIMLKLLRKTDVVCVIQAKDANKLKNICDEIMASELQSHCTQKISLGKGLKLHFKAEKAAAEEEDVKENVQNTE